VEGCPGCHRHVGILAGTLGSAARESSWRGQDIAASS
jgi:hypothetical protein